MSVWTSAIVAAISSVRQPPIAPTSAAVGACSNSGCMRAIRYTPAVTIVAAWISAETGVGPSIASGSHVWSGTWADLANAPTSSSRQADDDGRCCCGRTRAGPAWKRLDEVDRAGVLEEEERAEHEPDVADHVDHERLDAGARGGRAPVPERDQQVGRGADERPADDQQHEVAGQHQQQHREDEVVQVGEVPRVAAVRGHVRDRVEVDQRRDAGDDQRHEHRQRVDEDRELGVDADA